LSRPPLEITPEQGAEEGELKMAQWFNFDNFALTFIVGLIAFSWLSFLSVIFFG